MRRFTVSFLFLAAALTVLGCNEAGKEVDQVQTSLVDKSIFEGDWWYGQTVIHVDGDGAGGAFAWMGEQPWQDMAMDGSDYGLSPALPRIRWVIDENHLFAYRAYELQDGATTGADDPDFLGQPLAAFPISRHVDVRYDYSSVTGEVTNVRVEDSSDRRWFERRFMYVDWSANDVSSFVDPLGGGSQEPASFFIEDGAHPDFPAEWAPEFVTIGQDSSYRFADEWPANMASTVHYMSFVTQELRSPGADCLYTGGGPCQTVALAVRHAFLRKPPNHEYPTATQTHAEYDRFGVFRTFGRTYIRGDGPRGDLHEFCNTDDDCVGGSVCDTATHFCTGGLSYDYGDTDFLNFYRPRMNFWADSLTDQACTVDWQCDNSHGTGGTLGSVCDQAAQRCTVPLADRPTRQFKYYLNPGYPTHLVKTAAEVISDWNETFMRGQRAVKGTPLPTGPRVACQSGNPIDYCWCGSDTSPGSPEVVGGTCAWRYDPFQTPEEARAAGVTDPYQCHVRSPVGWTEPENPTSFDDYPAEFAYDYEFVGDECLFILDTNSCNRDPSAPCEQLGDLRYTFFNYIQHGGVYFGGVAAPQADPTTGELLSSQANLAGDSIDAVGGYALETFPALRCAHPTLGCAPGEEGADSRFATGENLRDYFARLGNTSRPVGMAASGSDGYTVPGGSRPSIPAIPTDIHGHVSARMAEVAPRVQDLRGAEGRARIYSGRMRDLAGTSIESRLLASLGPDGSEAMASLLDPRLVGPDAQARDLLRDDDVLQQISPFRGRNFTDMVNPEEARMRHLGNYGICRAFDASKFRSRYWEWWAEAFRGRPLAEASIRMRQVFTRGIQKHEVGHCVGLRHNFGSSFDFDQYYDGALNVAFDHPLPQIDDYDDPRNGGNASGFVEGLEVNRYLDDLRDARNERDRLGLGNYGTGSVMEYAGDLSDTAVGLGHYDTAAIVWSYFDKKEAFVGDPRHASADSLNGRLRSQDHGRVWWQSYRGGESCDDDAQCPYTSGSPLLTAGQPIFQRCITNPRDSRLPLPCAGGRNCVCSAYDEDFLDYKDGAAYNNDTDGDGALDFYPVNYLFCSDVRTTDISWCTTSDSGESFGEAVDNFRRRWTESYPVSYYRRFRRTGLGGGYAVSDIVDAAKIYQHLFFRYFYEPGFSSDDGALGIDDQFQASIDIMNWFTEMVQLPDVGSYELDAAANVYRRVSELPGAAGADFSLEVGEGYPMWSAYQEGYSGFFRRERAGVFWDKFYALLALAIRDWGFSFTIDERLYINFYDLFGIEMTEFFGGMILNNPRWVAPRVEMAGGTPQIDHLTWYRGNCLVAGDYVPCRDSQEVVYPGPAIDGTTNDVLRDWATILALAEFPVYYDTSFEQRLIIFKLSSGEGWGLPNVQPDGTPTCAFGNIKIHPSHETVTADTCGDPDYVVFESDRFHTSYIAVKVRSRLEYNLEEEQLGFQLLEGMVELQREVRRLRAIPMPTAAQLAELRAQERNLNQAESYLEYLIEIQRRYGISNYFY